MPKSQPHHLTLLGDSIFDNARYTMPSPGTTAILQELLRPGWTVELAAQDGATTDLLSVQLGDLSRRPDVMVLSLGGNDAAMHLEILSPREVVSTELLTLLQNVAEEFEQAYRAVLESLLPLTERLIVCTIYEPPLENPEQARLALVPLAMFNDRIIRTAATLGADVLDLRSVCTAPGDFVMEIEPSAQGAQKIAAAIAGVVLGRGENRPVQVYSRREA
jgi:lysophospholipase L1-like esterase